MYLVGDTRRNLLCDISPARADCIATKRYHPYPETPRTPIEREDRRQDHGFEVRQLLNGTQLAGVDHRRSYLDLTRVFLLSKEQSGGEHPDRAGTSGTRHRKRVSSSQRTKYLDLIFTPSTNLTLLAPRWVFYIDFNTDKPNQGI